MSNNFIPEMPAQSLLNAEIDSLVSGTHAGPFNALGLHCIGERWLLRTFQPNAINISIQIGNRSVPMHRLHDAGLFEATLPAPQSESSDSALTGAQDYYLRICTGEHTFDLRDAYGFSSTIGELDAYFFHQGRHNDLYKFLGANRLSVEGIQGIRFAVWAPNAHIVSVVGSFNNWDRRRHVMRHHPACGIWEIFVPDVGQYARYKYCITLADGQQLPLKTDPFARHCEAPPGNASIVFDSDYAWQDMQWQSQRTTTPSLAEPISIYEVHAGSWRHVDGRSMSYRELAEALVPYATDMGFTHVELLPINEHPFTGSWGYQPTGLYAPTQRFGNPDDFRYFIDTAHQAGLAVIVDWVPGHFPADDYALACFDGTHLYEHADPRQGVHKDWDTLIYNFGRNEVRNFLVANATYWINEFHVDGLRVDAVASMLYLDYSREDGQWVPNQHGGNENLEAIALLQEVNQRVHAAKGITFAEESTSWNGVSRPVHSNGLGFTYKWNMGWMHDTLEYMSTDSLYRSYHQDKLTFGITYAFSENFALPFSHDEVVYGKGSLIGKMTGDQWQSFANLRCLYAYMFAYPGKKLLFMGCEFAQQLEWSHDGELDWPALEKSEHRGISALVKTLNHLYQQHAPLYERDCIHDGFDWIDCTDAQQNVVAWYRRSGSESLIIICHFAPHVLHEYCIGVDLPGAYREILNSDNSHFGGSGISALSDGCTVLQTKDSATDSGTHNRAHTLCVTLPPLATLYLQLITDVD